MSLENIQNNAIKTYNNNINYLKTYHEDLYNKINLFNQALDLKAIEETFSLEIHRDTCFEIINNKTKKKYYGMNSNELSQKMVEEQVNFSVEKNTFKTFYEFNTSEKNSKLALNSNVLTNFIQENSPFINFKNTNLPKKEEFEKIYKYIILGVGLGIHIPLIHKKIKSFFYLIIEPNLEIFRLSLFVTDYSKIAKKSKLILCVADEEIIFKEKFKIFLSEAYVFDHYIKLFKLSDESNFYIRLIQDIIVGQDHLSYRYDRIFPTIYRTNQCIEENYNIVNLLKARFLSFTTKPILILAAGPSLQKNISFVKENQNKFCIMAIYAVLPLLEKHQIKPDIVTQYDAQKEVVTNTLDKIEDFSFFDETIFLFASHLNKRVYNSFNKNNIFIFQAMYELKKDFGVLTSPSIGELTYALSLILSSNQIFLLGLDLALDKETGKSHIDNHTGSEAFENLKTFDESDIKNYSKRNTTIKIKGNFDEEMYTTPVFQNSVDVVNFHTRTYKRKETIVYNLSDGAFFQDTIPLKIETINFLEYETIDKKDLFNSNHKFFENISEKGYNQRDKELMNLKKNNIKRVEKILKRFKQKNNYKNIEDYKSKLFVLFDEILIQNKNDKDLENLLQNFALNNLHYIFYILNQKEKKSLKEYQPKIDEIIYKQFSKILDTYAISLKI